MVGPTNNKPGDAPAIKNNAAKPRVKPKQRESDSRLPGGRSDAGFRICFLGKKPHLFLSGASKRINLVGEAHSFVHRYLKSAWRVSTSALEDLAKTW